jgi:molybdopterin-guanine dinucleotide biosynthesis protein B
VKVWGVVGWKNCGKTGLVERLVAHFVARGLTVSTVKHTHHGVDLEVAGTDTHRHRTAGASQVMLASGARWALMTEHGGRAEPDLAVLLAAMEPVDLVLVEGFKSAPHPKIEAHRSTAGNLQPLIALTDPMVRAVASDGAPDVPVPVLPLDDTQRIAAVIAAELGL